MRDLTMELKNILAKLRKADHHYHMIEEGDRIAVGVSGGKDSMVLLTALHWYSKFKDKHFEVVGIHIEMGFPDMDFTAVRQYCAKYGIAYEDCPSNLYATLRQYPGKDGKIQCSRCSALKKGAVIKEAKKRGCNKVAFGHHGDDAVETLFLNMMYGGKLATFEPSMYLTREAITFIRPLIYCFEEEITHALRTNDIPFVASTCEKEGITKRTDMKRFLQMLYQHDPLAKENLLLALHNEEQVKLWHKDPTFENNKRAFHAARAQLKQK